LTLVSFNEELKVFSAYSAVFSDPGIL